jgi:putative oxidoreductase
MFHVSRICTDYWHDPCRSHLNISGWEAHMDKQDQGLAGDIGLFVLRATFGGLMAGHGAQKLFGILGGHGLEGTAGWLESIGLKPGKPWAVMAGASEFGSGLLMVLGLLEPVGPISAYGPMITAWVQVHGGKPIWNTSGGAELPLLYISAATALALTGPGRFSLDRALGIKVPAPLIGLTAVGVAAGLAAGMLMRQQPEQQEDTADEQMQIGGESSQRDEGTDSAPTMDTDSGVHDGGMNQTNDLQDRGAAREVGGADMTAGTSEQEQ